MGQLQPLLIKKAFLQHPIIQGGMGIGISNYLLAGTVSKHGGLGVISSAALDRVVSNRIGKKLNAREAAMQEVADAKKIAGNNPVGINVMVAAADQYEDSILGAMDGGVDVIISGAGLPLNLPDIVNKHPRSGEVALVPIVSSARAINIIIRKWQRFQVLPDAVVVEGPLAGGHIGWQNEDEAFLESNRLEQLVQDVLNSTRDLAIPVIAAGGIFNSDDICRFMQLGCSGVQMGTRFVATFESGASAAFKKSIMESTKEDILLASKPGSPCGLLFRVLRDSPFYQEALAQTRTPKCDKGYVLHNGNCQAKDSLNSFCICNGLLSAVADYHSAEKALFSVGARADEIDKIVSVEELMRELTTDSNNFQHPHDFTHDLHLRS